MMSGISRILPDMYDCVLYKEENGCHLKLNLSRMLPVHVAENMPQFVHDLCEITGAWQLYRYGNVDVSSD
jgi:hypothetical protein